MLFSMASLHEAYTATPSCHTPSLLQRDMHYSSRRCCCHACTAVLHTLLNMCQLCTHSKRAQLCMHSRVQGGIALQPPHSLLLLTQKHPMPLPWMRSPFPTRQCAKRMHTVPKCTCTTSVHCTANLLCSTALKRPHKMIITTYMNMAAVCRGSAGGPQQCYPTRVCRCHPTPAAYCLQAREHTTLDAYRSRPLLHDLLRHHTWCCLHACCALFHHLHSEGRSLP